MSNNCSVYVCYHQMEMDDDDEEEEEDEEEEHNFSGQDLMKIRDTVVHLVQSILKLLQTFPLKDRQQSASYCAQVGIDLVTTHTLYHTAHNSYRNDSPALLLYSDFQ